MNYLWLKVKLSEKNRLLLKCYKNKLFIYDSNEDQKYFYFKIKSEDQKLLKKVSYSKVKVVDETGIPKIKKYFKKYFIFIVSLIIGLIIFVLLTHVIVNVSILNEYPTKLEWLEIEVKGMNYIVRVEERKIHEKESVKTSCNIVAIKDGLVKKLIYSKGEALVKTNDYVKKGDILISGTLMKDEEVKSVVCATGKVYAEVWYKATIKVPLVREENILTGKVRYNLKVKNNNYDNLIFRCSLKDYNIETYPLFKLFNTSFSFVKEKEIIKKEIAYTDEELNNEAERLINEKVSQILSDNEYIINKKVLQTNKLENSLEVVYFLALLEQIGEQQSF